MLYPFKCESCAVFFMFEKPMADEFPKTIQCNNCGSKATERVWTAPPIQYLSDGFHTTDYTKEGHKQDLLRKRYERDTGEPAPPPASDSPKNYRREGFEKK